MKRWSIVDNLVSHTQIAFIWGRSVYDGWVVGLEILDVMKKNKKGIIFKLDFEKGYDHVKWPFLSFVLHNMGFGYRWIRWICRCIFVSPIFFLVYGSPGPRFHIERVLGQGCPLSPLFFNLVGEAFLILVKQYQEKRWLEGISIPSLSERILVLQFIDDTILVLRTTNMISLNVQNCLTIFSLMFGLRINLIAPFME